MPPQLKRDYPSLNVVIHNAGIARMESIQAGKVDDAEAIITTNLLGPIRLTGVLLPLLEAQPHATIMTVSSGLGFLPTAIAPTYCATKAAIHSYTQSLRYQLKDTAVQVLELIPPYVQTELMSASQATDPNAMPLKDFIAEAMQMLKTSPDATEICAEKAKPLRFAEANGGYDAFFQQFNMPMKSQEHFRVLRSRISQGKRTELKPLAQSKCDRTRTQNRTWSLKQLNERQP